MKGNTLRHTLIFLSLLIIFSMFHVSFPKGEEAETEKNGRILFISSYSYAWDTVQIQIDGIKKGIRQGTTVDYEFMDTKRFGDEEQLQRFYENLKYNLEHQEDYDVIILGDDSALVFALEHRDELFPDTPLVFEGVNDESLALEAAKDPLITGVLEKLSIEKNIDFARSLYPDATRVVGIFDNSLTGQTSREQFFESASSYPDLEFAEINTSELTSEELIHALAELDTNSILIYVVMTEDASGKQYTNSQSIQLISQYAKVPAFRMVSGGIGEGLLGGNIVSMEKSGEIAAEICMDIIDGTSPSEFDVVVDSPNIYCVDEAVMKKFNLDLSLIPDGAKIINHEENFWERHQTALVPATIIILLLLLIIALSISDNANYRKLSRELTKAKQNLENAYYHDTLTGLKNRTCLIKDLENLSHSDTIYALMMIDIDNFKQINDTYGHHIGDEALQQIGKRLTEISTDKLMAYRLAGDEFLVIAYANDDSGFYTEANLCIEIFRKDFDLQGISYHINGSIGIAISPNDTENIHDLMSYADKAMYKVKKSSKNAFCFYQDLNQTKK